MAWPKNRLTELLQIELPLIQAPMAGITTPALAAAVAGAGGLGSLGLAALPPEKVVEQLRETRAATNRAINANFFVHEPPAADPDLERQVIDHLLPLYREQGAEPPKEAFDAAFRFDAELYDTVSDALPRVISFQFGLPEPELVSALKKKGHVVLGAATTVREARLLEIGGVDAVIAQGHEAGGHRGVFHGDWSSGQVGTLALVPQVVDAVRIPVIAAGGIADGRGIAAAFVLGASAVQIGTAYMLCPEAVTHPLHREAIKASEPESTRITAAISGRPARGLENRLMRHAEAGPRAAFARHYSLTKPLAGAGAAAGSADMMVLWAGQASNLARDLPAGKLTRRLMDEAASVLRGAPKV